MIDLNNPPYQRNWPLKNTGSFWKDILINLVFAPPTFLMPVVWLNLWLIMQYETHLSLIELFKNYWGVG